MGKANMDFETDDVDYDDDRESARCDDCRALLFVTDMQQMQIDGELQTRASGAPVWICDDCADEREHGAVDEAA
jgi:hypothetical protein